MDSIQAIRLVAQRLGPLLDRMVFLGGATLGLLVHDPGAAPPRATKDVDLVVETTMLEYLDNSFRAQLLSQGFREASEENVICRWVVEGIKVDIMTITPGVFGSGNRWYPVALAQAQPYQLSDGLRIRLISPACFLATKLEAFASRGRGDYQASHDLEDFVAVVDGRSTIEKEIESAPPDVRGFIAHEVARYLSTQGFVEALSGQLPGDVGSQSRLPALVGKLQRISLMT